MKEKIKPTDLMIGNYITDIHSPKSFFKVEEIRKKTVRYGYDFISRYGDLRLIPLTEEILLKCSFKLDDNKNYWISLGLDKYLDLIESEGYYYPQLSQEPEMLCDGRSVVSLNRISALYQLQNLFKALTGNDLNIAL